MFMNERQGESNGTGLFSLPLSLLMVQVTVRPSRYSTDWYIQTPCTTITARTASFPRYPLVRILLPL